MRCGMREVGLRGRTPVGMLAPRRYSTLMLINVSIFRPVYWGVMAISDGYSLRKSLNLKLLTVIDGAADALIIRWCRVRLTGGPPEFAAIE
jgi:hypothetical protein